MKVTVNPLSDAQVWQLAQDVERAYRAALKPPLILPSGLEGWLKDRRAKTIE